jgi:hypothetical protein
VKAALSMSVSSSSLGSKSIDAEDETDKVSDGAAEKAKLNLPPLYT